MKWCLWDSPVAQGTANGSGDHDDGSEEKVTFREKRIDGQEGGD